VLEGLGGILIDVESVVAEAFAILCVARYRESATRE
jgi:hypothetical protein